jgi:hypothetical protein
MMELRRTCLAQKIWGQTPDLPFRYPALGYGGVVVEKGTFPKIENFSLAYHHYISFVS